jgi:hypothetical protein
MKPKPFASLNHFTVPVAMLISLKKSECRADARSKRNQETSQDWKNNAVMAR